MLEDTHLLAQKDILGDQRASTPGQIPYRAEQQAVAVRLSPAFQMPFGVTQDLTEGEPQGTPKITQCHGI